MSPKLEMLYKAVPLKFLKGGRGSAKSWGIAEALVYYSNVTYKKPMRILCAREFQASIKESAKKLIENTIDRFGLTKH